MCVSKRAKSYRYISMLMSCCVERLLDDAHIYVQIMYAHFRGGLPMQTDHTDTILVAVNALFSGEYITTGWWLFDIYCIYISF